MLDFEFNVTVDSCVNNNFYVVGFHSLAQFTKLSIFMALIPESTSISISSDPLVLMFSDVFLKNGNDMRLKYLLMVLVFTQSYLSSPSLGRICTKVKA